MLVSGRVPIKNPGGSNFAPQERCVGCFFPNSTKKTGSWARVQVIIGAGLMAGLTEAVPW